MKAAVLDSPNSVPVYGDFAEPGVGPDTQVVELVAAGIHHVTRSVAAGRHYGSDGAYPLIPGLNAVARTADGQLVFTSSAPPPYGTFAERIASPDARDAPGLVLDFVWGPVAETAVPSALLRSRKLTISGSGAGSVPAAEIRAQLPRYLRLIADGSVQVPFRTFPLSDVAAAWTASAGSGLRVVLVRD
jgi:hypothetical protein